MPKRMRALFSINSQGKIVNPVPPAIQRSWRTDRSFPGKQFGGVEVGPSAGSILKPASVVFETTNLSSGDRATSRTAGQSREAVSAREIEPTSSTRSTTAPDSRPRMAT